MKDLFRIRAHSPYVVYQQDGNHVRYESHKLDDDLIITEDNLISKEENSWIFKVNGMTLYVNNEYVVII